MSPRYTCAACSRTLSRLSRSRPLSMPLRAKIIDPAFAGQTPKMFSNLSQFKEQPGDEPEDVVFGSLYGVRTIELNRPKKLNSLNGSMARKIVLRLKEWEKSQLANVIVMAGAGEKAFCAGGDVAVLAQQNKEGEQGQAKSRDYFALEYRLDHLIATYSKPYVAYMDGVSMGGGAGLSVHAPFRIATERTNFAFPETRIGFFPDVGASFFLPRLDGHIGRYLALTGASVKGVNVFYSGIATHYMHSTSLGALTERLAELQFQDYASLPERLALIDATIEEFATGLPHDEPMLFAARHRRAVDRCFRPDTVEGICAALGREARSSSSSGHAGSDDDATTSAWAAATLRTLEDRSPTSLKVALRALRHGRASWDIATAFRAEHHIAGRFMAHPDFARGVAARLVERREGRPPWSPARIEQVTDAQVDAFFPAEGSAAQLALLADGRYAEYPFGDFGLPADERIRSVWEELRGQGEGTVVGDRLVHFFVRERNGKPGVREKVRDFLVRWELEGREGEGERGEKGEME